MDRVNAMTISHASPYVKLVLAAAVLYFATGLYRLVHIRRLMRRLRRQGLSFAPHHPVLGSLVAMQDIVLADLPSDVNPQYFPLQLRRHFPELQNVYYFDMWPFIAPILVVASPSANRQACQDRSLPKYPGIRHFFAPMGGPENLVSMEGATHKKWRAIFNPGFSSSHIISLAPEITAETLAFCRKLSHFAESKQIVQLKNLTDNFTMDVIGKIVLDTEFNAQTQRNPMIEALRNQVQWLSYGTELNLWQRWHPIRPIRQWLNTRTMNRYLEAELRTRFHSVLREGLSSRRKSVVDRTLQTYMEEVQPSSDKPSNVEMDRSFEQFVIDQIKLFLFSGHDTTSTTLCYIFYFLWANPDVAERLRAEHNEVIGDPEEAISVLLQDPHILNKLPFTLAVIKETLRLFPLASSTRQGEPGFSVVADDGREYPTEECLVWSSHMAIHRSPEAWYEPDTFLPDRWLSSPGDKLYPTQGAWRPFEFGPRSCIGQELAIVELKMALIFVVRRFAVDIVYEEWDNLHPRKGSRMVSGERAYLSIDGGPSEGLPCRLRTLG